MLMVVYIPFFNPIFNTKPLGWQQWELVLPMLLIPSVAAEITKLVLSRIQKLTSRHARREQSARLA
jgi:Ca2+-transporting ATPase